MQETDFKKYNLKHLLLIGLVIFIYFILSLILYNFYKYQINSDAIHDISIALKYSQGLFRDALNGYRSPLISLLLVPFIRIGIEPLFAYKILNIFSGAAVLFVLNKTINYFKINIYFKIIILFLTFPIIFFYIFYQTTPDMLSAIFLLLGFNCILDDNLNYKKSIILGLIFSLGYYSKAYNLIFFIIYFSLIFLIKLFYSKNRKSVLINFVVTVLTCLILCLPFIILLSIKYNNFTITTIGIINYKMSAPEYIGNQNAFVGRLREIKTPGWFMEDDLSYLNNYMAMWFSVKEIIKNTYSNIIYVFNFIDRSYVSLFFTLLLIFYKTRDYLNSVKIYMFFLIFIGGYVPFVIDDRLFCAISILYFVLASCYFYNFYSINKKNIAVLIIVIFFISFAFLDKPVTFLKNNTFNYIGRSHYAQGKELSELDIEGKAASNLGFGRDLLYIAYYNRTKIQYYGATNNDEELNKFEIQYYFCSKKDQERINDLANKEVQLFAEFDNYLIYKLR